MPAYVVTAVDTSANTLTATGVAPLPDALNMNPSLVTGDRFRLRNVGGALPAATPALAQGTDYWAIRVSQDVIKVATSQANALAGVAVDITGSLGAGTTTIEYQLPYALPTAASAKGTQIHAVDNNTTWSALVALYDLLTAQSQTIWSGIQLAGALTAAGDVTTGGVFKHPDATRTVAPTSGVNPTSGGATIPVGNTLVYRTGASGGTFIVPIPTRVGERLRSITFSCKATGSGAIATAQLVRQVAEVATNVGSSWASSGSTSFADFASAALNHTVTAGGIYMLCFAFSGTASNTDFERIDIVADQP